MKRSRFSDAQISGILEEQEAGAATANVCCRHGISGATFYKWKAKFGGLEVTEAKRLRTLEGEAASRTNNAKLEKLLAEAMLDIAVLKDISTRHGDARREAERGRPCPGVSRAERASAVRVSAPGLPAGPRGPGAEPQEAAAALSRGRAQGAPLWRPETGIGRRWCCRRGRTNAGHWISCPTHRAVAGGFGSYAWWTTSRPNAWRWWPTRRYRVQKWGGNSTRSWRSAASPWRWSATTARS
jgi:putative transposase